MGNGAMVMVMVMVIVMVMVNVTVMRCFCFFPFSSCYELLESELDSVLPLLLLQRPLQREDISAPGAGSAPAAEGDPLLLELLLRREDISAPGGGSALAAEGDGCASCSNSSSAVGGPGAS